MSCKEKDLTFQDCFNKPFVQKYLVETQNKKKSENNNLSCWMRMRDDLSGKEHQRYHLT